MAKLPQTAVESPTVTAIYSWWENKLEHPRAYLGGSVIGQECERRLWYSWRWCQPPGQEFDGRMRRLFDRGHREEETFVRELRGIGCQVHDVDPSTGQQFRFKAVDGHFGGGIDGVVLGVPEAPKTWHLVEMKTHNERSFTALLKEGVAEAKPEHEAQMQVYMHLASLTRALYLAVNKNDDSLHAERVRYDEAAAERLMEKAERIIYAPEPLPGISADPAFYKCKWCPVAAVCHGTKLPPVSCRTCVHATPELDGDGRWSCAKYGTDLSVADQAKGSECPAHLYVPALLERWGEVADASEQEGWIEYRTPGGDTFRNGTWGPDSFSSRELSACSGPAVLADAEFLAIRARYQGRVVEYQQATEEAA